MHAKGARQQVVRTSAAGKSMPATTGAPSVFAMAKSARRGGARPSLPPLDRNAVVFEVNAPKPPRQRFSEKGDSKYAFIFDGLTAAGMCAKVPLAYKGTLVSQCKKRSRNGAKFSVARVSADTIGVWRDA